MREKVANIAEEIKIWSEANFGDQSGYNQVAPLLGIAEEIGEYVASGCTDPDAIGDCTIFLIDYVMRTGWKAEDVAEIFESLVDVMAAGHQKSDLEEALYTIGMLYKCELKRIQGIRGYIGDKYRFHQQIAVLRTLRWLESSARKHVEHAPDVPALVHILETTWTTVSRRNWKANPETGVAS